MREAIYDKIIEKIDKINKDLNCEDYNGMSEYYYYLSQDMPQVINGLKWSVNELLKDILTSEQAKELNALINKIRY